MARKPSTIVRSWAARRLADARASVERRDLAPEVKDAGVRTLDRAERVLQRLEGAAGTLETAARLELELLRRLAPIVDDLGELVRHTLDEARERRGLKPRGPGHRPPPDVIDVE